MLIHVDNEVLKLLELSFEVINEVLLLNFYNNELHFPVNTVDILQKVFLAMEVMIWILPETILGNIVFFSILNIFHLYH